MNDWNSCYNPMEMISLGTARVPDYRWRQLYLAIKRFQGLGEGLRPLELATRPNVSIRALCKLMKRLPPEVALWRGMNELVANPAAAVQEVTRGVLGFPDSPRFLVDYSNLFREILGNPLRPQPLCPRCKGARHGRKGPCPECQGSGLDRESLSRWRTPEVLSIARSIRADYCFQDLLVLRDALLDAGCSNGAILDHCRSFRHCPSCSGEGCSNHGHGGDLRNLTICDGSGKLPTGRHFYGCWVLELFT